MALDKTNILDYWTPPTHEQLAYAAYMNFLRRQNAQWQWQITPWEEQEYEQRDWAEAEQQLQYAYPVED